MSQRSAIYFGMARAQQASNHLGQWQCRHSPKPGSCSGLRPRRSQSWPDQASAAQLLLQRSADESFVYWTCCQAIGSEGYVSAGKRVRDVQARNSPNEQPVANCSLLQACVSSLYILHKYMRAPNVCILRLVLIQSIYSKGTAPRLRANQQAQQQTISGASELISSTSPLYQDAWVTRCNHAGRSGWMRWMAGMECARARALLMTLQLPSDWAM